MRENREWEMGSEIKKPLAILQAKGLLLIMKAPHPTFFHKGGGLYIYTFSAISHTPQGQMPAQKPQPIHLLSSTTYSKDLFGSLFRVMAP